MGFSFRQRISVLPGVHLNVSGSGLSVSLGVRGAHVTLSPTRAPSVSLGIPGTGISYRTTLDGPSEHRYAPVSVPAYMPPAAEPQTIYPEGTREIHSAPIDQIATVGNGELRRLIQESRTNRRMMAIEVEELRKAFDSASASAALWDNWLLRRLFANKVEQKRAQAAEAYKHYDEAREKLASYGLTFEWTVAPEIGSLYDGLVSAFSAASSSIKIWDITAERKTNKFRERTTSDHSVDRKLTTFTFGRPDCLPRVPEDKYGAVPQINNVNGATIYIFPGFYLMADANDFAVIDAAKMSIELVNVRFTEDGDVPRDATVIGQTWLRANSDGSRDERFKDNRALPIVGYTEIGFQSGTVIDEMFMLSNAEAGRNLAVALRAWASAMTGGLTNSQPVASEKQNTWRLEPSREGVRVDRPDGTFDTVNLKRAVTDTNSRAVLTVEVAGQNALYIQVKLKSPADRFELDGAKDPLIVYADGEQVTSYFERQREEQLLKRNGKTFSDAPGKSNKLVLADDESVLMKLFGIGELKTASETPRLAKLLGGAAMTLRLALKGAAEPVVVEVPLDGFNRAVRAMLDTVASHAVTRPPTEPVH